MKPRIGHFSSTRLLLLAALTATMLGLAVPARASLQSDVLQAIHLVENPHDVSRPGRFGELGAYQFRAETWRMHTDQPFANALDRATSDAVAAQHFQWICRGLERNGVPVTAYNVALAWNGGLKAAVKHAPAAALDYAERVNNLVEELNRTELASAQ
jgi:hypothetical protein